MFELTYFEKKGVLQECNFMKNMKTGQVRSPVFLSAR